MSRFYGSLCSIETKRNRADGIDEFVPILRI